MPVVDRELSDLGEGEQQAISLAKSLHAELLLCDDKDARDAAQRRSLRVVGTLGVLQEAARNGLLNLQSSLAELRATNFRISRTLIDRILEDKGRA